MLTAILASCVPNVGRPVNNQSFAAEVGKITTAIRPGEAVAVSWVYDGATGDITALGDIWRDRLEKACRDAGVMVKARQDIGFIIDEAETFGASRDVDNIRKNAGADVIIAGSYRIIQGQKARPGHIEITFKALRVADAALVRSITWSADLPGNWARLAGRIRGNAFHHEIEAISGTVGDKPYLKAKLNRDPACFPTGSAAIIRVTTEAGVYLYILNPAADNTVTLLYPNSRMPAQALPAREFIFPPPELSRDIQLLLYPLTDGKMSQESFKVVASRHPLDFSFLPVPENTLYTGARGGNMKKMLRVLQAARGLNEVTLPYWVGDGCK